MRSRRRRTIPGNNNDPLAPKIRFERAKGAPEPPADHTATAQLPPSTHPDTMYLLRMRVRVSLRICTLSCAYVQFCLLQQHMQKSVPISAPATFVHANIHPGIGINQYGCTPEFMHLQLRSGASCFEFMKSLSKKSA